VNVRARRIFASVVETAASLGLAAVSLLLLLVVIEAGLRVFAPLLDPYLFPVITGWKESDYWTVFEYDEALSKELLRPVERFRHVDQRGEYDYEITTTACHEFYVRPPCRKGRDVALHFGDSFTFGFGMADHETFVSLLDQSGPYRHVNFGIAGDNLLAEIDQARVLMERLPAAEQPRILFFHAFLGNDIRGSWRYLQGANEHPSAVSAQARRLAQEFKDSKLRVLVKNRIEALRMRWKLGSRLPEGVNFSPKDLREIERMDSDYLARVDEVASASGEKMARLRTAYGGEVVVTLIPPKEIFLLRGDTTSYQRRRDAFASALGPHRVVVIDMLESVPAEAILPLYFKIDTHFNPHGHEWFAQLLRSQPPLSIRQEPQNGREDQSGAGGPGRFGRSWSPSPRKM
jgi:hypothetical protein